MDEFKVSRLEIVENTLLRDENKCDIKIGFLCLYRMKCLRGFRSRITYSIRFFHILFALYVCANKIQKILRGRKFFRSEFSRM